MPPRPQLPNKTGYSFSYHITDEQIPVNSVTFAHVKFADSEAEALALVIDDIESFLEYLNNRQKVVGKVVRSPFVAVKNDGK